MNNLHRYLELIVDPTFEDFHRNPDSVRHAFLTCVAIYHSIDRVAEGCGKRPASLRGAWAKKSLEFKLVDVIAHHFKHVKSADERIPEGARLGLPIAYALGFNDAGDTMDLRNLYFVIRDALQFVHAEAKLIEPT